jgi:hypothetical protein
MSLPLRVRLGAVSSRSSRRHHGQPSRPTARILATGEPETVTEP